MSLTLLNRKFENLHEREKEINQYFDPVKAHNKQHPNIQDLRDDHKEEII
jgi:hypothetical protein